MTSRSSSSSYILHQALRESILSTSKILEIITQHPHSLTHRDENGSLPIHTAINTNQSLESIAILIDAYPESIRVLNAAGYSPLARACCKGNFKTISYLVDKYPEALCIPTNNGKLPIHIMCRTFIDDRNSDESILFLANRYPESLRIQDSDGYLPIHYACMDARASGVIYDLVNLCPEALMLTTRNGEVPLHILCLNTDISGEIIINLTAQCSDSLRIQDSGGNLPIHIACGVRSKTHVIPFLIEMYPESLLVRNRVNRLPIHIACWSSMPSEAVMCLAAACPDSLVDQFHGSELPLHSLFGNYPPETLEVIVQYFVRLRPQTVHITSTNLANWYRSNALDVAYRLGDKHVYRLVLNGSPRGITESKHRSKYHELNFMARKASISLISSWSKIKSQPGNAFVRTILRVGQETYPMHVDSSATKARGGGVMHGLSCGSLGCVILYNILLYI